MINIAIDGPSGAGKSVLAKSIARTLGFAYVDTGALYRTVGYYMYTHGVNVTDASAVAAALPGVDITLDYTDGEQRVLLCGEDAGEQIRMPAISMYASAVAAVPQVRAMLLSVQRDAAKRNNTVMDGRDIGTVILPKAAVKIFLSASLFDRAQRRFDELTAKGVATNYDDVCSDMKLRDERDSTRDLSPCIPALDAVLLDNSGFTPAQTLESALSIINAKLGEKVP